MSKNKSKFSLEFNKDLDVNQTIDRNALKKFANGALNHSVSLEQNDDWQNNDPNELPTYNFRLRLNKYQIGLLKEVANLEQRSLSNLIKVILMEQLQQRLKNRIRHIDINMTHK